MADGLTNPVQRYEALIHFRSGLDETHRKAFSHALLHLECLELGAIINLGMEADLVRVVAKYSIGIRGIVHAAAHGLCLLRDAYSMIGQPLDSELANQLQSKAIRDFLEKN